MFIKSRIYLDDEYVVMTRKYFLEYTQLEIREFCDTLIQHMVYVKKLIDKRALHKREYESRMNERQIQTIEEKVDSSNALDASLVETESSGTESKEHDTTQQINGMMHMLMMQISDPYMMKSQWLRWVLMMRRNKTVEQRSFAKKPERQIPKGHRFSIKKTSVMHEKTMTPRSCLSEPQMVLMKIALTNMNANKLLMSVQLKPVPKVVPSADTTALSKQELDLLFGPLYDEFFTAGIKDGVAASFQLKSNSLPHAHTQTTKTCYKHQDLRIKKAQELKTKTSANSDIKDNSSETKLQGRLLESFQKDAKYEHTNMNDLESDDESVDTPLVSPFPHSDNDSDDGEVLNELLEYENVRMLHREKAINGFDGDDFSF
ncbi:hypothetical protein Tco_0595244 [Tanacetum coccineum]